MTIKYERLAQSGQERGEISLEDAAGMLAEAERFGRLIMDKRTGRIVSEITADLEEIMIIEIVGGG